MGYLCLTDCGTARYHTVGKFSWGLLCPIIPLVCSLLNFVTTLHRLQFQQAFQCGSLYRKNTIAIYGIHVPSIDIAVCGFGNKFCTVLNQLISGFRHPTVPFITTLFQVTVKSKYQRFRVLGAM